MRSPLKPVPLRHPTLFLGCWATSRGICRCDNVQRGVSISGRFGKFMNTCWQYCQQRLEKRCLYTHIGQFVGRSRRDRFDKVKGLSGPGHFTGAQRLSGLVHHPQHDCLQRLQISRSVLLVIREKCVIWVRCYQLCRRSSALGALPILTSPLRDTRMLSVDMRGWASSLVQTNRILAKACNVNIELRLR